MTTQPASPYAPEPVESPTPVAATPTPAVPIGTDLSAVILTGVLGAALVVLAIVNQAAELNFPSNAPVEQLYAFGITVDLLAGGIALLVRFFVIFRRPRIPATPRSGPGPMVIIAASLGVLVLVGWFLLGGADFFGKLAEGVRLRYYLDVTGAFLLGIPWIVGLVLGVAGFRRGKGAMHLVLSLVAIVPALFIVATSLFSAVVYGLGLSD